MSETRRTLQKQTLAQLREHARQLHLPTTGRKSALADCLYRAMRPGSAQQETAPLTPSPSTPIAPHRTPATADLAETVQQLINSSLQGVKECLLQVIYPQPRPTPATDNLFLPSRDETQHPLAAAGVTAASVANGRQSPHDDEVDPVAQGSTTSKGVAQPPVPAKIAQRIIRGEFIDLDSLLHESLYLLRYGSTPFPSFSLRLANDPSSTGEMIVTQQRTTSKCTIQDLGS